MDDTLESKVLHCLSEGVVVLDHNKEIVFINASGVRIFTPLKGTPPRQGDTYTDLTKSSKKSLKALLKL